MNERFLFSIILFVILLHACNPDNKENYRFDPRNLKGDEITLSDLADRITYEPLDNSFPLGNIRLLRFVGHSVYFYSDEGIIAFDREEKKLIKIGQKGRGPGEYLYYHNFAVDDEAKKIYVLDQGAIIKIYSGSGQFIKSFPLQDFGGPSSIDFFHSKLFVTYSIQYYNAKFNWVVFDTVGNVIKKRKCSIQPFSSSFIGNWSKPIYIYKSGINYWNVYLDTVFTVLPDLTEIPSFIISPGEHRLPYETDVAGNPFEKYMILQNIFESDRFIVIRYFFKEGILSLYDKIYQKNYLIRLEYDEKGSSLNGISNDIDGGPFFVPFGYFTENGIEFMVGLKEPVKFKTQVTANRFSE